MVTTEYHGRTGNNLFQYVFARLIAEKNGLAMTTPWPGKMLTSSPERGGMEYPEEPQTVISDFYKDDRSYKPYLDKDYSGKRVHCRGFFQHYEHYWPNRDKIRGFFNEKFPCARPDAIVIHLRLGDYWSADVASVIHPTWHRACLSKLGYRPQRHKLYIVCENPNDEFVRHYAQFRPEFVSGTPESDFAFIASCGNIICSNSSFCWWAAFLGNPKRVMTFGPLWMRRSPYVKLYDTPTWECIRGGFIGENYCTGRRRMGVPAVRGSRPTVESVRG